MTPQSVAICLLLAKCRRNGSGVGEQVPIPSVIGIMRRNFANGSRENIEKSVAY